MQVDRRFQVLDLLGEAKGEAGEPPHERADREIVPLDMRGAYRHQLAIVHVPPRVEPIGVGSLWRRSLYQVENL